MIDFDTWFWGLAEAADDFCPDSEPKIIKKEYFNDEVDITYNCHICENSDCEYWSCYNVRAVND